MAYLGYKNKAFREYKREQERIRMLAFQKEMLVSLKMNLCEIL